MLTSDAGVNMEGVGIDNFHVYDLKPISDTNTDELLTSNVSGSLWTDIESASGILLSINPSGQDLGLQH